MSLYVDIHKQLNHFSLDVTFETNQDSLALFGASGSGKSMTLKCIAGIETPDRGRIVLNGKVLFDSQKNINLPPQKRKVGYLFQNFALFPHMTVLENISISGQVSLQDIKDLLKKFDLEGLEDQYPYEISGGQQQRVAICRMLASLPEVLLFDEPFSSIDSFLKDQLHMTLLELIHDTHKDVCIVTHDFKEAYNLCTNMVFMDKGQCLAYDTVKNLYTHPRFEHIASLLGYKNIVAVHHNFIDIWNYTLQKQVTDSKLCIPSQSFHITSESHGTIAFHSYEVINDFEMIDVVFKGDYGKIWASFSKKEWDDRPQDIFYLYIDESEYIQLEK